MSAKKGKLTKIRTRVLIIALAAAICALTDSAIAQHSHSGQEAPATSFSNLPSPPRMTGIGTATIKVTTNSSDAQRFFDQGLNLLHAFWDMEAYRAFREATRIDPDCAMAWWGVYNALAQNAQEMADERAAALKKAVDLMPKATEHEQYYLRAISLLAETGKGRPAWIAEMEALINKYPNDIEAQLLLANSLSSPASSYLPNGRPREGKMYGRSLLQNLLKTHPEHAAVHHYWIHAVENGPRPEEALESAEKLTKLAPNSGHMLHMPGHIYYRLGMYERARAAFLASLEFDLKYMRENKIHPINNWNYTHNLDYLVANCAEEGRYKEAVKYAGMLAEITTDEARIKSTGLGYMLYGGNTALVRLQMRFSLWDEAASELEKAKAGDPTSLSEKYRSAMLAYLKGMASVEKGMQEEAAKQLVLLQRSSDEMTASKSQNASDWYFAYAARIVAVQLLDLRGSLSSIRGEHETAIKILAEAAAKERDLGYWEPPHYTRPVLESLGAAYTRAGKYEEARAAFEKILETRPNSGFAYLGIAKALALAGNSKEATAAQRRLAIVWKNADKDIPQTK